MTTMPVDPFIGDDLIDAVLVAARAHYPVTESVFRYDCWSGKCEHDECVEEDAQVCAACYTLGYEINDFVVYDDVMADRCPVCIAVAAWIESTAT
jgi:hypothetical protein